MPNQPCPFQRKGEDLLVGLPLGCTWRITKVSAGSMDTGVPLSNYTGQTASEKRSLENTAFLATDTGQLLASICGYLFLIQTWCLVSEGLQMIKTRHIESWSVGGAL